MSDSPDTADALVIGAGPAGLAAAAELGRRGLRSVVIDSAGRVGASWARHYDRLHLHTSRGLSALPGLRIPRRFGRWVARDDLLDYFAGYAAHHRLDVRLGVTATALEPRSDGSWAVGIRSPDGTGTLTAPRVVVATGYNRVPHVPDWEGTERFRGVLLHSSDYRNPAALGARSVLVVGAGNSGAEIAADLAAAGVEVRLAVRTPPNIVRRQVLGLPSQYLVLSITFLPTRARDVISGWVQRLTVGDLTRFGVPRAPRGIVTQMERDDVTPTIDVGLLDALRSGAVKVVPAVERFTVDGVELRDGSRIAVDAVVAATGYRRGLDGLVGHLGVLAPSGRPVSDARPIAHRPGLFFLGYSNPLSGNLRQLGIDARRIARQITASGRRRA